MGSIPGWGTKIPHAIWCGQKNTQTENWNSQYYTAFFFQSTLLKNASWGIFPVGTRRLPCYFWWQPSVPSCSCGVAVSVTLHRLLESVWSWEQPQGWLRKGIEWGLWLCLFSARAALLSCGSSAVAAQGATWSFLKHWIRISRNMYSFPLWFI